MKVNLAGVKSAGGGFDPVPAGWYHCKVTDGEIKISEGEKTKGQDYITWELTVQEGEYEGRKFWNNSFFQGDSIQFTKGFLDATGRFTEEQLNGDLEFEIEQVIGADLLVKIKVRAATLDKDGSEKYAASNNVTGVKRYDESAPELATAGAATGGSLLP